MADRDQYRGYPSGRYYEGRDYERGSGDDRGAMRRDRGRDEDRGFFERAGEEIRSWFGDDDDRGRHHERDRDEWRGQIQGRRGGSGWESMASDRGRRDRDFRQDASEPWGGGDRGGWDRQRPEGRASRHGAFPHDEHYSEWRQQQIDALDRDYDEYRRENRERFHTEFANWRGQREQQRSSLRQAREHMDVVGSDGEHIGTVDKVSGDRIILTKGDPAAGGHHHSIPCGWVQSVDQRVTLNKTAEQAREQWRDEDNRRALFESEDQRRNDGPHMLNRSFSGTYENR